MNNINLFRLFSRLCSVVFFVFLLAWLNPLQAKEEVIYYITDAMGNVKAVMDEHANVIERTYYEPYGRVINRPLRDAPGYTGHIEDAETGLVYMQQRYYDPLVGRFLSVDPIGVDVNRGTRFNRYGYANNNPYRFTDPDGRESVGEMIDRRAMGAASRGEVASTFGWSYAGVAWDHLGYEGLSQIADKGFSGTTAGNKLGAGLELAGVLPFAKVTGAAVKAAKSVAYGPLNPGPLAVDVANTFRSGSYTANTLLSDKVLYRVTSEGGNSLGKYWTSVEPKGPLQSVIDSALEQNWGNTATQVHRMNVPAGTTIYEGAAAAQRGLVGGGNQIYIPQVNSSWFIH